MCERKSRKRGPRYSKYRAILRKRKWYFLFRHFRQRVQPDLILQFNRPQRRREQMMTFMTRAGEGLEVVKALLVFNARFMSMQGRFLGNQCL